MNLYQQRIVGFAVVGVLAMGIYPPWTLVLTTTHEPSSDLYLSSNPYSRSTINGPVTTSTREEPGSYGWLFDPPVYASRGYVVKGNYRIDFLRLAIQWILFAVACAGGFFCCKYNRAPGHATEERSQPHLVSIAQEKPGITKTDSTPIKRDVEWVHAPVRSKVIQPKQAPSEKREEGEGETVGEQVKLVPLPSILVPLDLKFATSNPAHTCQQPGVQSLLSIPSVPAPFTPNSGVPFNAPDRASAENPTNPNAPVIPSVLPSAAGTDDMKQKQPFLVTTPKTNDQIDAKFPIAEVVRRSTWPFFLVGFFAAFALCGVLLRFLPKGQLSALSSISAPAASQQAVAPKQAQNTTDPKPAKDTTEISKPVADGQPDKSTDAKAEQPRQFEEAVAAKAEELRKTAKGLIQQNAAWIYEKDKAGKQVIGNDGRPALSLAGMIYMGHMIDLERLGAKDPTQAHEAAVKLTRGTLFEMQDAAIKKEQAKAAITTNKAKQ